MSDATLEQQAAIRARGNVLVVAGAGTGKTRTVVERCLAWLADPHDANSLDQVLMVTFTDAAAAEMRQRIRATLELQLAEQPADLHLAEQFALVDTALVCTLHSFCFRLVREYFYRLALDPQVTVLTAEQSQLLARETLDRLLQKHYAADTPIAQAVQDLIYEQGQGWDQPVRELVLRLHQFTQTLFDPAAWFQRERSAWQESRPRLWERCLLDGVREWRDRWQVALQGHDHVSLRRCADALKVLTEPLSLTHLEPCLETICQAYENWPRGDKQKTRKPFEEFFKDAQFVRSLVARQQNRPCVPARVVGLGEPPSADSRLAGHEITPTTAAAGTSEPLVDDWNWVRPNMAALIELTAEFGRDFDRVKHEMAAVDFQDLEQFALDLLWDRASQTPTAIARQWREKLRLIFVDEYQDINEAQNAILLALGREGAEANRFLVGDLKQSIYRFRLANPKIFQSCQAAWQRDAAPGKVLTLSENFRSHEGILNFINALFVGVMCEEVGGLAYDASASLKFGAPATRGHFKVAPPEAAKANATSPDIQPSLSAAWPRVELHLCLTGKSAEDHQSDAPESETEEGAVAELSQTEKEARRVALRLRDMHAQGWLVWDESKRGFRSVAWSDMAILLRSPRYKAESYAKEFARLGIPLLASRAGFYETSEINDLISLLQILDNPLQDLPLLAVLRSPLVGLTNDELALVRIAHRHSAYWTALQRYEQLPRKPGAPEGLPRTVATFLTRFAHWRGLIRQVSLSQCLETILDETFYEAWLASRDQGEQKRSNVRKLLNLTRQFDQFQRQGLFRFLKFVEAQWEAEISPDAASPSTADAVQLMSIHQSKGLEFPVVVAADLGKPFNFRDLSARIILDEKLGLCPQVKPPASGQRYPSLPYWLASKRHYRDLLGEEMRLLYVCLTRASDRLILVGSVSRTRIAGKWSQNTELPVPQRSLLSAKSFMDWLGCWLAAAFPNTDWSQDGGTDLLAWFIHDEGRLSLPIPAEGQSELIAPSTKQPNLSAPDAERLRIKLSWEYPFAGATREIAKTSVSTLRRRANEEAQEEAWPLFSFLRSADPGGAIPSSSPGQTGLSATDVGTAHHKFMQYVDLSQELAAAELDRQAVTMEMQGRLTPRERAALDLDRIAGFWASDIGRRIQQCSFQVQRELSFTLRMTTAEVAGFLQSDAVRSTISARAYDTNAEFIIVQGVIDLAVIQPGEIWVLDYKTDRITPSELASKVKTYEPQIQLYARAMSQIYQRPVTGKWLYFFAPGKPVQLA